MSEELKDCPVCGNLELRKMYQDIEDVILCKGCGFFCQHIHWNSLPRKEWIPVSERLPEDGQTVWAWEHRSNWVGYGTYLTEHGFCEGELGTLKFQYEITHWMEVERPHPPKADK